MTSSNDDITRRQFVGATVGTVGLFVATAEGASAATSGETVHCVLTINGRQQDFKLEPRVTLLDLLREQLHLTGAKKGCDHGQCGACTVLADGVRINSCLALAVGMSGKQITTIEGIATGETLHPLQAAFIEHDGFQCGFCTPGQICSAVGMLKEAQAGMPSSVTLADGRKGAVALTDDEIRERMAGNLCRCGAYANIVAAVRSVTVKPVEHPVVEGGRK